MNLKWKLLLHYFKEILNCWIKDTESRIASSASNTLAAEGIKAEEFATKNSTKLGTIRATIKEALKLPESKANEVIKSKRLYKKNEINLS